MPNTTHLRAFATKFTMAMAALWISATATTAQTYGFATMQPGTLNHTTGSAIAKVLKDKVNINAVIQPTAGESVLIPLVARRSRTRHCQHFRGRRRESHCHGSAADRLDPAVTRRLFRPQG
jgi:hypothetical protein